MEALDQQDLLDFLVLLEIKVSPVFQAIREIKAHQASQVLRVKLDHQDCRDLRGLLGP